MSDVRVSLWDATEVRMYADFLEKRDAYRDKAEWADVVPNAAPEPEPAGPESEPEAPAWPAATQAEAVDVLRAFSAAKGADNARFVLDTFGVRRLPELSDEKRAELVAKMRAQLAA